MEKRVEPYLFRKFPGLSGKVPWTALGTFPTPVARMDRLGEKLGCERLYIKRDDLSGEDYGGNKVRKLEFCLADARDRGRSEVITAGAVGSNHVLATTIYCRKLGLKTAGIFVPQPVQEYLKTNILCNCTLGCKIIYSDKEYKAFARAGWVYLSDWVRYRKRPYLLWAGGSSTLGVLGYVEAALEIADQVKRGEMPEPEFIFVPVGSAGTLAGMLVGVKLAGLESTPVGVRVYDRSFANEKIAAFLANRALKYLRGKDRSVPAVGVSAHEIFMMHDYFGPGYAHFTEKGVRAVELLEELEGVKLDGTYTGKTMAALIDFMSPEARRRTVTLFVNTYNSKPLDPLLRSCPGPEILPPEVRQYCELEAAPVQGEAAG